jgi:hypothetical protein
MRTTIIPKSKDADIVLRRRTAGAPIPKPSSTRPGRGIQKAEKVEEACRVNPDGPTVVKVRVALPPAVVVETGFEKEQVGAGFTIGAILHASVTVPL